MSVTTLTNRKARSTKAADAGTASVTELLPATEPARPATGKGSRGPRKVTAPKVDPMFSDDAKETVDEVGTPEDLVLVENEVEENAPVKKERRMHIQAEFVPGKAALATMTADALKAIAFVSTYNTVDEQSSSPRQHGYQRDPMAARFPAIGKRRAGPSPPG